MVFDQPSFGWFDSCLFSQFNVTTDLCVDQTRNT